MTRFNLEESKKPDIIRAHTGRVEEALTFVRKYCKIRQPVLDLGCKEGFFINALELQKKIFGLDCTFEALKELKCPGICGDAHYLPFKGDYFNTVIMSHVLEHCYDVNKVIEELERIIKGNGNLFIEVPLEPKSTEIPTKWGHYTLFEKESDLRHLFYRYDFTLLGIEEDKIKHKWVRAVFRKNQ